MPLEINEIHIQMRVGESHRDATEREAVSDTNAWNDDRAGIVEDVVRRVLNILKTTRER